MRSLLLACLMVFLVPLSGRSAVTVTDDAGRTVTLKAPASRIVSLYAPLSHILTALNRGQAIAGRTVSDEVAAADPSIPVIGTYMRPNPELVLAVKPDLVLHMSARSESAKALSHFRDRGIPVAVFDPRSFPDLFSVIERIGILTGSEGEAAGLVRDLQRRLAEVERVVSAVSRPRPTVFIEIRYPNLLTAGPDSLVADIVTAAGGQLVAPQAGIAVRGRVVRFSEEELVRLEPDVYIVQQGPMNKNPVPLTERPHYARLRAVAAGRWHVVNENVFSRPGPGAVDAVEILARLLYPDLFPPPAEGTP